MGNRKQAGQSAGKSSKLSVGFKLRWSSFGISTTVAYTFLGYMTLYATNVLGLNAAAVGIALMVSKVFDGVSDIIVGWMIDKTHTRLGKARPYMLAIIGFWACIAIYFSVPPMGETAGIIFLFVMYTLIYSVFNTLFGCAEAPYMANALEDTSQSMSLVSFNGVFSSLIGLVAGIALPQIISAIGFVQVSWMHLAWALAIPLTLIGLIRFFTIPEVRNVESEEEEERKKTSTKDMLRAIKNNKYIILLAALVFLAYFGSQLASYCGSYYALYVMGDLGVQSIMALALIPLVLLMAIYPALVRKFTLRKVVVTTMILGIIGSVIRLIDLQSIPLCFVASCLVDMSFTAFYGFASAMLIDCMDYGEWKTGIRVEGMMGSVQSFMNKIGAAAATGIGGVLLGIAHFDGTLTVQPASAVNMIIAMCTWIPVIIYVIFLIVFHFYDLEPKLPGIREDLRRKKENAASAH